MGTKLDFKVKKGLDVEGGDITVATGNSVYADTFDTNVAAAGVTLSGTTLQADGTDTDINIAITPKGSGEVDISKVDIDGGAIDGTTIGGTTAAAGTFTSGTFTSLNLSEGDISDVGDISTDSISVDDATVGLNVDFSGANTGTALITLGDNLASALDITDNSNPSNSYLKFVTTNDSEAIELGKDTSIAGDLSLNENNITNVGDINTDSISVDDAAVGLDIQFGGQTGLNKISLTDDLADALNITQGANSYMKFVTTNDSEAIELGKDTSIAGDLSLSDNNITNVGDINADSISVDAASTGLNVDFSGGNDATGLITLKDNVSQALRIVNGDPLAVATKTFIEFDTTDDSEEIKFKEPISILGSAADQDVAVIKTTNAVSSSGNAFDIQWYNGSNYASAFKVSAKYGRIGIGTAPDNGTNASAYKVKIGGNANVAGTVNATGNLTVTGTGSTGGDFMATGNSKPVKLRMSDGFPTGSGQGSHPITDYDDDNFYSSMVKETTLPNASGTLTGSTVRSIGYINVEADKDLFQVVEIFATISIKAAGNTGTLKKRLTEKIYGILSHETPNKVETVREWSHGDTELGSFICAHESDADGYGNGAIEVLFRYSNYDYAQEDEEIIALNINGLSIHGTPPS